MSNKRQPVFKSRLRLLWAYGSALMLPCVAVAITLHVKFLDGIPAALFLAAIAITAWFGLTVPTVIAVVVSALLHNYYIAVPRADWSSKPAELAREAVVVLVAALIGFFILRLRKTEAALARSEAEYRVTLSSIGDAVIATDMSGVVTFMNPVAEALTGWKEADAVGKPLAEFFLITNEETGEAVENPVDKVRRLGTIVAMANHTQLERRDGTMVPIDDSAAPIRTADGGQTGIVLVFRDVSRRREAEKQQSLLLERARLAEAELRGILASHEDQSKALAQAQQAGKSAAWVMDVHKPQVRFLPGGYQIFGRPFEEIEGRIEPIDLVEEEDQPKIWASLKKTLETGAPFQPEFRVRWPNGEMHCQEARGALDPDTPGVIRGTTFDITERKHAELSLLRVEKLAAVGRIASTIAHEINNPLAAVTNLMYLVLLDPALGESSRGFLLKAQEELSRLSNITRLTLSYVRPQKVAMDLDPAEVIENVLSLFRVQLQAKGVEVIWVHPEPARVLLTKVRVIQEEMQRVVTNLIANAIDAVGDECGALRVSLKRDGAEALLVVEDNGIGIPEDRVERIFDPFYTTKEETGTGIGLWVTKELVEKNGGSIRLSCSGLSDGMRTRFEVRFPARDSAEDEGGEDSKAMSIQ